MRSWNRAPHQITDSAFYLTASWFLKTSMRFRGLIPSPSTIFKATISKITVEFQGRNT